MATKDAAALGSMLMKGQRPTGMKYNEYAKIMKSAGKKPLPAGMFEKAEESKDDDDEDDEDSEKSFRVSADALRKSIDAFELVEQESGDSNADRLEYLQARLGNGAITKSERGELAQLVNPNHDGGSVIRKSLDDRIEEDDEASGKLVRANSFLKSLTASIDASLEAVQEQVSRDSAATRNAVRGLGDLTKSLAETTIMLGSMVDTLHDRLTTVERTPNKPRAQGHVDPRAVAGRDLNKSGAAGGGEAAGDDKLSKGQILSGFRRLADAAAERDDKVALARITHNTAKFESTNQISRQDYGAVQRVLAQ